MPTSTVTKEAASASLDSQILVRPGDNPDLVFGTQVNSQCEVYLGIDAGKTYSRAIIRSDFLRTSVQCPDAEITVQISNLPAPATDSDNDWVDIGAGKFVDVQETFKWMRLKVSSAPATQLVGYVVSLRHHQ